MKLRLGNMSNCCLELCYMIGIKNRVKTSPKSIESESKIERQNHELFLVVLLDSDNVDT